MMKMEYCPECGKRMIEFRHKATFCPKCRYEHRHLARRSMKHDFIHKNPSSPIVVLDREVPNYKSSPVVNAHCPKCGGFKAETWIVTAGSEGIETIEFYRCVSCGHTWRETE
jgi:DNA-directed RNA polymerase subunit M